MMRGEEVFRFILNVFALIFVILVNYLANALPFNGQTTSEVANRLDVLFTPAGYVFSIWGVIYLLLLIWVIRQLPVTRRNLPIYKVGTPFFILTCFLNSFWLFLWHYEYFILSVVVMLALLVTLIILYRNIKATAETFTDVLPFSVYLGWISVATIANISYVLVEVGWNGFGLSNVTWTMIMLVVATFLATVFRLKEDDSVYPLVFVWAFIGIAVRNFGTYQIFAYTAIILATIIFVVSVLRRRSRFPTP